MKDSLGNQLETDDYICDSRGRCYQILPTESGIEAVHIALCSPVKGSGRVYVRLYDAIKLGKEDIKKKPKELMLKHEAAIAPLREQRREELRERRRGMDELLRDMKVRNY